MRESQCVARLPTPVRARPTGRTTLSMSLIEMFHHLSRIAYPVRRLRQLPICRPYTKESFDTSCPMATEPGLRISNLGPFISPGLIRRIQIPQ
jgi:hypothetical protein